MNGTVDRTGSATRRVCGHGDDAEDYGRPGAVSGPCVSSRWRSRRVARQRTRNPPGENGIVTSFDHRDELRRQRYALFTCEVCRMTRPAQQTLHFPRPVFFLNFDECLEFPQMMRVAQRVQYAFQGKDGFQWSWTTMPRRFPSGCSASGRRDKMSARWSMRCAAIASCRRSGTRFHPCVFTRRRRHVIAHGARSSGTARHNSGSCRRWWPSPDARRTNRQYQHRRCCSGRN